MGTTTDGVTVVFVEEVPVVDDDDAVDMDDKDETIVSGKIASVRAEAEDDDEEEEDDVGDMVQ
jgi:hypothetical protein